MSATDRAADDYANLRAGSAERATDLPTDSQIATATAAPDLAGVIDKLQQVRQIDPAAEQKLLEELRQAPAESWSLVAEQFRASLAYREQLAATKRRPSQSGDAPAAFAAVDATPAHTPSATIGALVETQQADPASALSERMARSLPYPMPAAIEKQRVTPEPNDHPGPAAFTSEGTSYPINTQTHQRAKNQLANATPAVVHARFDLAEAESSSVDVDTASGIDPTNHPSSAPGDNDWLQLVKMAAENLGQRVAKSPTTTAEVHQHVSLRILHLLAGDTEKALEPIPHISPNEQDYWSRQLFALATYLDHHSQPDDKRRAAASVTHLDDAVANLRELGSLSVRNLSFCKNVYGYGAIEPYDKDSFSSGEQVSLYVEVENYHSRSTEKGYCTSLGSTYEIVSEEGVRVGGGEIPDVEDCCRSRRRDFHIQYGLTLPEKLAPGQYRLQLVIKDRQSDKIGHATAAFEIRGTTQ